MAPHACDVPWLHELTRTRRAAALDVLDRELEELLNERGHRAGRPRALLALRAEGQDHGVGADRQARQGALRQDVDPGSRPREVPGLPDLQRDLREAEVASRRPAPAQRVDASGSTGSPRPRRSASAGSSATALARCSRARRRALGGPVYAASISPSVDERHEQRRAPPARDLGRPDADRLSAMATPVVERAHGELPPADGGLLGRLLRHRDPVAVVVAVRHELEDHAGGRDAPSRSRRDVPTP